MNVLFLTLMANPQGGKGGGAMSFLPLLLIIFIFYFFMIRPQMRKNKEIRKFRENLKKGDKIITIGGIHGKIIEIDDTTFIIEVEGQNRLKIERSAVAMDSSSQLATKQ